jgi:hypothetical protein
MAVSVDEYVVRFYVSMNEAHLVDALDGTHKFRDVKP